MFLRLNDNRVILVWWFECGMIVWLQYDGVIVLFVNVVNAYKSKKLQRNVKQKIDWKNHKKYRLSFLQHFPQYRDTGIPWRSLKTREKRLRSWFGLPSCIPVYLLKTLKSKSAIFYIITRVCPSSKKLCWDFHHAFKKILLKTFGQIRNSSKAKFNAQAFSSGIMNVRFLVKNSVPRFV